MPPYGEFIFGHEYAGDVVAVGETVDEFRVGDRVVVEAHMGCRRCENCIRGQYTACLNYGNRARGHRANGFTTDGGLADYAVNHINTLYRIPPNVTYEVKKRDGEVVVVERPSELPDPSQIEEFREPVVRVSLLVPSEAIGPVMQLALGRRGKYRRTEYVSRERALLVYDMPMAEILYDFYDL